MTKYGDIVEILLHHCQALWHVRRLDFQRKVESFIEVNRLWASHCFLPVHTIVETAVADGIFLQWKKALRGTMQKDRNF